MKGNTRGGLSELLFGNASSAGPHEIVTRAIALLIVIGGGTYAIYALFTHFIIAESLDAPKIVAIDVVRPGEHRLSGVVLVPSACHGLSVVIQEREKDFHLAFETWEEPSRNCSRGPEPRQFNTIVYAPSIGARFSASVDERPVELEVVRHYER